MPDPTNPNDPYGGIVTGGGGSGDAPKPDGNIVGDKILMGGGAGGAGNVYIVKKSPTGALYFENVETGGKALFGPGMYITPDGRQLNVLANGDYKKVGELNQDQTINFLTTGEGYNIDPKALAGEGGSGSTHVAQPYGYVPPDPQGAAKLIMDAWAYANELIDQGANHQEAMAGFEMKWKELQADTNYRQASLDVNVQDTNAAQNRAENEDRRLREAQEASNRIAIADQATTRGRSVMTDYLPNAIQGATAFNFGGMRMPLMNVSPSQIFNQGGPGDLSQIPRINPNPATPYQQFTAPQLNPIGQMPNFPTPPVYQPPPDITALIQQIQSGTGPMGWA